MEIVIKYIQISYNDRKNRIFMNNFNGFNYGCRYYIGGDYKIKKRYYGGRFRFGRDIEKSWW